MRVVSVRLPQTWPVGLGHGHCRRRGQLPLLLGLSLGDRAGQWPQALELAWHRVLGVMSCELGSLAHADTLPRTCVAPEPDPAPPLLTAPTATASDGSIRSFVLALPQAERITCSSFLFVSLREYWPPNALEL